MPVIYKKDRPDSEDSGMDSKDGMAKEDNDDSPSALLPKSILQGAKVSKGDKVILEVVHIYEDEVEVKYGKKDKDKKKDKDNDEDDDDGDKRKDRDKDSNRPAWDNVDGDFSGSQMEMSQQQLSGLMAGKLEG